MTKQITRLLLALTLIGSILVACGTSLPTSLSTDTTTNSAQTTATTTVPSTTAAATTVTAVTVDHQAPHDSPADDRWERTTAIPITLNGDAITADHPNITVESTTVTIGAAGSYLISGALTDGQIAVDTKDEAVVQLILDGVDIHHASSAAINVIDAEKVVIILADQSENRLSDGATYLFPDANTDEPNATLFSKADLSITGNGSLTVEATYNDGIGSKDGLVIAGGTISVTAVDDGIRGKDYLVVQDGHLTINAQGDGLKSDDEEDTAKGYIAIDQGQVQIDAGGDAIQAETDLTIADGTFVLTSGGGSSQTVAEDDSAKALKAGRALLIQGGDYTIDAADDALHANVDLVIDGGNFTIATGDDGVHADANLTVNGGVVRIMQSYEGIESAVITINGGEIYIVSSDDGVNAADGTGGGPGGGFGGGQPQGNGGQRGPRPGRENVNYTGNLYLYINGGYIVVDAGGDGIDANGAIEMTDGVVIVNGPTMRMNSALDYDGFFKMTGGFVVAAGSSGMAQAPGSLSTQNAALIYFDATQPAGNLVHLQTSTGEAVLTFAPTKAYQSLAISSPQLTSGTTYEVYLGGTATGTAKDGLYPAESYSGGTLFATFTIADLITVIGTGGR